MSAHRAGVSQEPWSIRTLHFSYNSTNPMTCITPVYGWGNWSSKGLTELPSLTAETQSHCSPPHVHPTFPLNKNIFSRKKSRLLSALHIPVMWTIKDSNDRWFSLFSEKHSVSLPSAKPRLDLDAPPCDKFKTAPPSSVLFLSFSGLGRTLCDISQTSTFNSTLRAQFMYHFL